MMSESAKYPQDCELFQFFFFAVDLVSGASDSVGSTHVPTFTLRLLVAQTRLRGKHWARTEEMSATIEF